jgi:hypothetical protein
MGVDFAVIDFECFHEYLKQGEYKKADLHLFAAGLHWNHAEYNPEYKILKDDFIRSHMKGGFINKKSKREEVEELWQEYAVASGIIKLHGRHSKMFFYDPPPLENTVKIEGLITGEVGPLFKPISINYEELMVPFLPKHSIDFLQNMEDLVAFQKLMALLKSNTVTESDVFKKLLAETKRQGYKQSINKFQAEVEEGLNRFNRIKKGQCRYILRSQPYKEVFRKILLDTELVNSLLKEQIPNDKSLKL